MKILIINPNSSDEMTATIDSVARKYALSTTKITTVRVADGPPFLDNPYLYAQQVPKVLSILEVNRDKYDYFILACGSDPGLDACRVLVKNIIGIGEAAIMTALSVARRFSFISSTCASARAVPDKLRSLGIDLSRFASARPVGDSDEIVKRRHEEFELYCQVGQKCIEDGAGAIILSCAGMSDLKERLEQRLHVPVIAGVISAVKMAEQFAGLTFK